MTGTDHTLPRDDRPPETDVADEPGGVLSDPYARNAVAYLSHREEPVDLAELSRGVLALVNDEPPDEVGDREARHVRTWLHHGHLPTLQRHGIVEYEPDVGTVELVEDWKAATGGGPRPPGHRREE